MSAAMAVLGLVGFVSNFLVAFVFLRMSLLKSPTNVVVFSLTLCNIGLVMFAMPLSTASNMSEQWLFGDTGCVW